MQQTKKRGSILVTISIATLLLSGGIIVHKGTRHFLGNNVGTFMWGCVTRPFENGAFAPCSTFVAQEIIKPLEVTCIKRSISSNHIIRVFEGGAGSGVFTRKIVKTLENIGVDYIFDVVEINPVYCQKLIQEFADNPHVRIHCISLLDWHVQQEPYDVIISSVPFSIFDIEDVKKIFNLYQQMIKPGGMFSYIKLNVSNITGKFLWGEKKKQYQERQNILDTFNNKYCVDTVYVTRNIPPVYIYHCKVG